MEKEKIEDDLTYKIIGCDLLIKSWLCHACACDFG